MALILNFSFIFDAPRVITSPFYVIATSMQLSVIPHLTIYGDVKPEQLKKTMGQRVGMKFKELTGFRSSTSRELVVPKEPNLQ